MHKAYAPPGIVFQINEYREMPFTSKCCYRVTTCAAAAGVEHSELVTLAEPLMAAASASSVAEPMSQYVGGDWRQFSSSPLTHAILAFEYSGGWRDVKGSVAMTVLQYLLGGGGSFSAGEVISASLSDLHRCPFFCG